MADMYEDFKSGVKRDVVGAANNAWGGLGLLFIIIVMAGIAGYFFSYQSTASEGTKILVGILMAVFTILMIASKGFGNFMMTLSMNLLLIIVVGLIVALVGFFAYQVITSLGENPVPDLSF